MLTKDKKQTEASLFSKKKKKKTHYIILSYFCYIFFNLFAVTKQDHCTY